MSKSDYFLAAAVVLFIIAAALMANALLLMNGCVKAAHAMAPVMLAIGLPGFLLTRWWRWHLARQQSRCCNPSP